MSDKQTLTTDSGSPIGDTQHSLTAGPRGPLLGQDVHLIETMAHVNRERVPERVVHAKGSGAYGVFTVTHTITRYTKAKLFSPIGQHTEVLLRFSIVAGARGAADAERDGRGIAVKFYTEEGNWDLVGDNTPVFFIRDPLKFSDFIHTQTREPQTNLRHPTVRWDFWSLSPESLHQVTILFRDRGLPRSYRQLHGFGSHTCSFLHEANERCWGKLHFKTKQGIANLTNEDAATLIGADRESAQHDLFSAIERGDYPKGPFYVQLMPEAEADHTPYNPFDVTKVWPHQDYPLLEVGVLALNRNPENSHAAIEQAALAPANVVPGISFSPDKVLQACLLSYPEAHRDRLGVKAESLPVNRPHATEAHTYHRDGARCFDGNGGGSVTDEPNSFGGPVEEARFKEPQHSTRVAAAGRALKSSRRTLVWVGKADASPASES